MASAAISSSASELLPELLGHVIAGLPFPADIARFRAVCRSWRSAAREHVRQLPWMVLPDASFCTIAGDNLVRGIPGLPENVTCLGSTADGWLALDCTDDEYRRTPYKDKFVDNNTFPSPRAGAMHRHTYMLHNPFSGETVPLPELDDLVGHVAETFEIRKVLMRSSSPDDVVAVATNNEGCNIILCRPRIKGWWVVPNLRVCDIAFHGGRLYRITPEEALVAFDLSEDEDGMLIVTKLKRVIMQPLAHGEEDPWSSMYDDGDNEDDEDDADEDDDDDNGSDDDEQSGNVEEESDDEASNAQEESDDKNDDDDELSSINEDDDDDSDQDEDEEESSDDDEASDQEVEYNLNGDDRVPDGKTIGTDDTVPYKPKDYISITRRLVESWEGRDLLMVRHHMQAPPHSSAYTRKVELFKADIEGGSPTCRRTRPASAQPPTAGSRLTAPTTFSGELRSGTSSVTTRARLSTSFTPGAKSSTRTPTCCTTPSPARPCLCLSGEDKNGRPIVTSYKRVIKHPLAEDKEDLWSWMDQDDDDSDYDYDSDCSSRDEEEEVSDHDDDLYDSDCSSSDEEEEAPDHEDDLYDDGGVPECDKIVLDDEALNEPRDLITTTWRLVNSRSGEELLMVRHRTQMPPYTRPYTSKVEVFRADIEAGQWVPIAIDHVLPQGEALFHSRSFCKSTRVYGDIKDGCIYTTDMDDVLDTRAGTCTRVRLPPQWRSADTRLLTWLFPPELVV
ncbi:unnamed protein product [Urochloa decumbens]|uniref:F-box domain-containing protein n=1 Tax=Urochloa decumbens TaxID=240449 RepID=A0ABC9BX40_9POAL